MVYLPDFKISLRPNNQVTITRQRLTRKGEPFFLPSDNENRSHISVEQLLRRYAEREGIDSYYDSTKRKSVLLKESYQRIGNVTQLSPSLLLDLTNRFQGGKTTVGETEKKLKRGYGLSPTIKDFSYKSGQKLRESGAIIDILCDGNPSLCRVITLTLPATGKDAYTALSNYSGYATNRLLQVIRDTKDEGFYWFYCVEHQKRGALHYHICLYHEDAALSEKIGAAIVSKWKDVLHRIGEMSGVDLLFSKGFARRVTLNEMQSLNQEMRKGCGAYFSKYASKNSRAKNVNQSEDINAINARLYPPSSFWGRSRNLVQKCKAYSFLYKFEGIENTESESLRMDVLDILVEMDIVSCRSFSFKKEITTCGGSLTVCEGHSETFYLSPADYQKLLGICQERWGHSPSSMIPERARRGAYLSPYEGIVGCF